MRYTTELKKLIESRIKPVRTDLLEDGSLFIDFGKAAFGTVIFEPPEDIDSIVIHLGEKLNDEGKIDRDPGGTIRYKRIEQKIEKGAKECRIIIPPDERNTGEKAILMPDYIGEVFPFRYAEIENAGKVDPKTVHQIAVHYPFDDDAAHFESSDSVLNSVWNLCKYSIKATTFCGVYVDGDRERIPYEGDAYINQLGHYCTDMEYDFARYSHEYMIQKPTWCTEWHLHSVMMAYMDYMYSGETASLEAFYDELCAKTLIDFARDDGLISVDPELRTPEMERRLEPHFQSGIIKRDIRDVMDWPPGSFTDGGTGERDNHQMLPINTVTNAFHAHALKLMSEISGVLGKDEKKAQFNEHYQKVVKSINSKLFSKERGIYIDGEGSNHSSLHSNMFMLAFDLVPEDRKQKVIDFVKSRGMACSVYGAQHLLEALYLNGEDEYALELMTATHDRSWWNMIEAGSTSTLEAWDIKYKNNLDWNHAWGAAPANIIPRYIVGVRPFEAGFKKCLIAPQPGNLEYFESKVPTPLGPIKVKWDKKNETMDVTSPDGMMVEIFPPFEFKPKVTLNGNKY
jgi:alpha-L-rhamnosidase